MGLRPYMVPTFLFLSDIRLRLTLEFSTKYYSKLLLII